MEEEHDKDYPQDDLDDPDKKKKKKKNKKRKKSEDKEAEELRRQDAIKNSFLHNVEEIEFEDRQRYAEIENDPMKLICMNLPLKITIDEIFQYFNTLISTTNPELADPPPIKDVQFDKLRTFAVLQLSQKRIKDFFRSHSEFTYIDGVTTFKVVKPKTFFQQKFGRKKQEQNKNAISISTGENKIYLGGLPVYFTDAEVRKICQTFGRLRYFNLVKQNNVSKGYCFYEYDDNSNSEKAIQALNNLPVADRRLKCQRATLGNKSMSLGFVPASQTGLIEEISKKPANYSGSFLLSYENIRDPFIQLTLSSVPECKIPSRVVQFLNMFSIQDLFDDESFNDIETDLKQECQKYGPVDKIVIPRPDPICGYAVPSVGKAFVKFRYIIPAKRARLAIAGKVYNKRTVVTSFYPEQKFNLKEYLISIWN